MAVAVSWILSFYVLFVINPVLKRQEPVFGELAVITSDGARPIEGTIVILGNNDPDQIKKSRVNITDGNGICRFQRLQAGVYSVRILHRSYYIEGGTGTTLDRIEISQGQKQVRNIVLIKGGVLRGRLLRPDNNPAIGIPVTALRKSTEGKTTSLPSPMESNVTSSTDDKGEYRLYGLRPGSYLIGVNVQRSFSNLKNTLSEYYPGVEELTEGKIFDVSPGQEIDASDMIFDPQGFGRNSVLGTVIGENRSPLEGVVVRLDRARDGYFSDSVSTAADGSFAFQGLSSGSYKLKAISRKGPYFNLEKEIIVSDAISTQLELEMKPYPTIRGQMYLRRQKDIGPQPSFGFGLIPSKIGERISLTTDQEGRFLIRTNRDGEFLWDFPFMDRESFLERITLDGVDLTYKSLELDGLSDIRNIVIYLAQGAGSIQGDLEKQDSFNCRNYAVYAALIDKASAKPLFVRRADECSNTSFGIYSLPPGRYFVVALPTAELKGGRTDSRHFKFIGVEDRDFGIIKSALESFKLKINQIRQLERNDHQTGVVPIVLDSSSGLRQ